MLSEPIFGLIIYSKLLTTSISSPSLNAGPAMLVLDYVIFKLGQKIVKLNKKINVKS